MSVKDRVHEELKIQLNNLQQYSRRYSVIVKGIEKEYHESKDSLRTKVHKIVEEVASATKVEDIDKFHRNGPTIDQEQDTIIRFKSHSAKEIF